MSERDTRPAGAATAPPPARPRRASWVADYPLDDELILHDARHNEGHSLNATGARIWALSDGAHGVEQIAATIAQECGCAPGRALAEVRVFLAALAAADLLEVPPGAEGAGCTEAVAEERALRFLALTAPGPYAAMATEPRPAGQRDTARGYPGSDAQ